MSIGMVLSILEAMRGTGISVVRVTGLGSEFITTDLACMVLTAARNVNIPWPSQGMGDGDYLYAFQEIVMPIAYEFDPDMVISELTFLSCSWTHF